MFSVGAAAGRSATITELAGCCARCVGRAAACAPRESVSRPVGATGGGRSNSRPDSSSHSSSSRSAKFGAFERSDETKSSALAKTAAALRLESAPPPARRACTFTSSVAKKPPSPPSWNFSTLVIVQSCPSASEAASYASTLLRAMTVTPSACRSINGYSCFATSAPPASTSSATLTVPPCCEQIPCGLSAGAGPLAGLARRRPLH